MPKYWGDHLEKIKHEDCKVKDSRYECENVFVQVIHFVDVCV